jgi:hypothetical protein
MTLEIQGKCMFAFKGGHYSNNKLLQLFSSADIGQKACYSNKEVLIF